MTQSILTKHQIKCFNHFFHEDGVQKEIKAILQYDDDCDNGHNTFSITGKIKRVDKRFRDFEAYGCLHEEIAKHFPKLQKYIKWHLCNSTGPTQYIANTLWHVRNSVHPIFPAGTPTEYTTMLTFGDNPIQHNFKNGFVDFILNTYEKNLKIIQLDYKKEHPSDFNFKPKFSFEGFGTKWHEGPFDSLQEADNFLYALKHCDPHFESVATSFVAFKPRDLDAARQSAIWLDATDEELLAPNVRERLNTRFPKLLEEFQSDMEELGFTF
jgi:predicted DNA-binding protein YlxM (UPF0122 family)